MNLLLPIIFKLNQYPTSSGVGLMNIKQRYSLLTNQKYTTNKNSEFSVQIPILNEEVIREENYE